EVRSVEPLRPGSSDPADQRAEVWTVTSQSMERTVRVEVYRAPEGMDSPNVYFLDGVGSVIPSGCSGGMVWCGAWRRERDVNVSDRTGEQGSLGSDWQEYDGVLGRNSWETFLTGELRLLLEKDHGETPALAHSGDWGALDVSMGAASALHLANA